jgi:hypothetical protein
MIGKMAQVSAQGAVLVDHVAASGPEVKSVRGSLIASSLQTLREAGHFERYLTKLPKQHHEALLFCLASTWLPIEMATHHYAACDALGLDDREMDRIGEVVSNRIMGTVLGTLLRSGRSLGATPTPWLVLRQYGRLCDRLLDGGTHLVREVGPKDAYVESGGLPLFRFRYFRVAAVGLIRGGAGMFAKSCYVKALGSPAESRLAVSVRWV